MIYRQYLSGRMAATVTGLFLALLMSMAAVSGCGGDSGQSTETTSATGPAFSISRPEKGTVEASDVAGDASASDATGSGNVVIGAATWIDITKATVTTKDDSYQFRIELSSVIPDSKPAGMVAAEWGFLLDTNGDGQPDWGIYAALPGDKLSPGLYNQSTKERMADAQFPGTYLFQGAALSWTVPSSVIGSPSVFKWVAYVDAAANSGDPNVGAVKMGDLVPDNAWPKADGWINFP